MKLRAWDKVNKRFLGQDETVVEFLPAQFGEAAQIDLKTLNKVFQENKYIDWSLFIEYTDKNGKEIFAGDIVKADWHWTEPHQIKWPDDQYDFLEYSLDSANVEIIGNIYEDPELVDVK